MELTTKDRQGVMALYRSTDYMLGKSPELPATILKTFLGVILWGDRSRNEEPMTILELGERLEIAPSTVSRHLRYLGERERTGVEGMGLVELHEYTLNRRYKTVHLTQQGRAVAKRLVLEMQEGYGHHGNQAGQGGSVAD